MNTLLRLEEKNGLKVDFFFFKVSWEFLQVEPGAGKKQFYWNKLSSALVEKQRTKCNIYWSCHCASN